MNLYYNEGSIRSTPTHYKNVSDEKFQTLLHRKGEFHQSEIFDPPTPPTFPMNQAQHMCLI